MDFQTVNPFSGRPISSYRHAAWSQAHDAIEAAWKDFEFWRAQPLEDRAAAVLAWAEALRGRREDLARLMSVEMGKPLTQSRAEIDKSVFTLEHIAREGRAWLAPEKVGMPGFEAEIAFEPVGPVLAVMPWNFPLWQVVRFAGPALLAGNTVILKHADLTAGSAELIGETAAALVPGRRLLRQLHLDHETTAKVIAHPKIRGVTFTGSTRGGSQIAATAAASLKKSVLELGGSDAYVVLADADAVAAGKVCALARLTNSGQSCVCAKRFVVHRARAEEFLTSFIQTLRDAKVGDPLDESTTVGPLASMKFRETALRQIEELKGLGGDVVYSGEVPSSGAFCPPTVILFDRPVAGLGKIEVFAPVATVMLVDGEDEALHAANDSIYGLGGAIFSADVARARRLAARFEAGFVAINDGVKSDVRLPFGGVKESGWGRELSAYGLREFCNVQTRTWKASP